MYDSCAGLCDSYVRHYARYSGAFSPTQRRVDSSMPEKPELEGRLCVWSYYLSAHFYENYDLQ